MTLAQWLDQRQPVPPPALRSRIDAALGSDLHASAADPSETLLAAGERLVRALLADEATTRDSALDLLAADALVTYAFEALELETVHAGWFYDNPASGHVLAKLGARHNGSQMRDCRARGMAILCHDMLLTRADFLRKQAA